MLISNVIKAMDLEIIAGSSNLSKEISGVYSCDLLSWVMSHAVRKNIWITVQIHPNIVAVASLLEVPLIIIPESISVEQVTIDKANLEGVVIAKSNKNAYELCFMLHDLGL